MTSNHTALVPAGVKVSPMKALAEWRKALTPRRRDDGSIVWCYANEVKIPLSACRRILSELESSKTLASPKEASRLAACLISCYPGRELVDPATYVAIIAAAFAEFPPDVGVLALDAVTRNCRFQPTRADVVAAAEKILEELRYAESIARRTITQHEERVAKIEAHRQECMERAERLCDRVYDRFCHFEHGRDWWLLHQRLFKLMPDIDESFFDNLPAEARKDRRSFFACLAAFITEMQQS